MIVPSMTHEEVYRELERDRDSLTAWWHHQLLAQRRRTMKAQSFPLKLWFEYKRKQIKTDRELYEEARRFYW